VELPRIASRQPGQEQAVHAAGAIAQNALSPFAAVARIGADPIGGAAGYLGGAFNYGVPTDRMRQITHAINAAYAPAIKAARAQGNTGRVQELMQQRDAQVQARLREDQQVP